MPLGLWTQGSGARGGAGPAWGVLLATSWRREGPLGSGGRTMSPVANWPTTLEQSEIERSLSIWRGGGRRWEAVEEVVQGVEGVKGVAGVEEVEVVAEVEMVAKAVGEGGGGGGPGPACATTSCAKPCSSK